VIIMEVEYSSESSVGPTIMISITSQYPENNHATCFCRDVVEYAAWWRVTPYSEMTSMSFSPNGCNIPPLEEIRSIIFRTWETPERS